MSALIRVLVVDDSVFFQKRISEQLQRDPSIEVVGTAGDGALAVSEAKRLKPDVITMDVEMPVMDGITAVKQIMVERPTPIIMFSAFTQEGAEATLNALDAGAVDFLPKQTTQIAQRPHPIRDLLPERVLALGRGGRVRQTIGQVRHERGTTGRADRTGHYRLVVIGASTGGPTAIQKLLSALPANFPLPILVVVHMPESFTPTYAQRLDAQCAISVKEAVDGDPLGPGQALVAPGGRQMVLDQWRANTVVRVRESSPGQTYRPSVDVTMSSAAYTFSDGVLAIVLTGMGADGKQAARLLKERGSTVWSQDRASCVVYGMPQAVEKSGLSDKVLPLDDIGPTLVRVV